MKSNFLFSRVFFLCPTVKCCRTYEEVHEGDVGKVVKLDRDELHDLNVQVDWQRKGTLFIVLKS